MSSDTRSYGSSKNLVPVHALIPEKAPGMGAILVMKDGSFRMILRTGAVNFDMKNLNEQGGLTYAFGMLVNSLDVDFPIEITSRSKLLDVDAYMLQFESRLQNERTPEPIRRLIQDHKSHFEQTVKTNKLLQRELYVAIPWKGTRGPLSPSFADEIPLAPIFKAVTKRIEEQKLAQFKPSDLDITTARQQLEIRSDQIIARLAQMSIWARRLSEDEVRKLLYSLFHPSLSARQADPGRDTGGTLLGGFSAEGLPQAPRRLSDGRPLDPPSFG